MVPRLEPSWQVTLGSKGSLLITEKGEVLRQGACPLSAVLFESTEDVKPVDETGAGDAFRAAFTVARFEIDL
jgi:sugar/nucleoside kinase (ribokinase family)